jgi:hypothetical protein
MNAIEQAYELYLKGDYQNAFECYQSISENTDNNKAIRSEAFNMMGAILNINYGYSDYSDYSFFKRAIELDPHNIDAHFNIIMSYGEGYNFHSDAEGFISSYRYLESLGKIDEELRKKLAARMELLKRE